MMVDDRPLRVAILSQSWPEDTTAAIAGSSVQAYYIARELARRGHPVLVILSGPLRETPQTSEHLTVVSVEGGRGLRGQLNESWLGRVHRLMSDFRPDVVYQRGKLPETVAASRIQSDGAFFVWASNSDASGERWKFVRKRWARRRQWQLLAPRLAEAYYADRAIERCVRRADLVIAQTEHQARTLHENFDVDPIIIGSGHPIPPREPSAARVPTVLWLANLTDVKQPWLFARLAERLRGLDVRFVMAGDAPDRTMVDRVEAIVSGLPNFSYVGKVPLMGANNLMKDADLFVLTSKYEGIPNTLIQACIHGVPTVSLVNDPDGIIRENQMGAVAETFDEMVGLVEDLLVDADRRERMGENAYRFAGRGFDIRSVVDRLVEAIVGRVG